MPARQLSAQPRQWRRFLEFGIQTGGVLVTASAGALSALVEIFWVPLHWESMPLPVAPVLALLLGYPLCRLARYLVQSRGAALAPAGGWFLMVAALGSIHPGGDLTLANNAMTVITIFLGAGSFAVGLFFAVSPPRAVQLGEQRS
jgi:hypothetical protein